LELSPPCDRRTLIRRLSLDLLGVLPTPKEVDAFLADPEPEAVEKLVDRYLASPRLGERQARHWLDVVRFAETNGFETNTPRKNAWPYRDWVIEAFNDDLPYARFIFEQLAGDTVGVDAATGFLVGGPWDAVKSPDVELTLNQRANELHDIVSTTGSAVLGLTVGCARCHEHKFDPLEQGDYYAVVGVFRGVQHGEREWRTHEDAQRRERAATLRAEIERVDRAIAAFEKPATTGRTVWPDERGPLGPAAGASSLRLPVDARVNTERFAPQRARFVRFTILATNGAEPCIDELEVFTAEETPRNVALASAGARATSSGDFAGNPLHKLEHLIDGRYGNGRSWISNTSGRGRVEIELAAKALIDRVVWARDREGLYADRVATAYRVEVSTDGERWTLVASSEDRAPFPVEGSFAVGMDPQRAAQVERLIARRSAAAAELAAGETARKVYAGRMTRPDANHLLHRGDPMTKREIIAPGGLAVLGGDLGLDGTTSDRDRRVAFARWVTATRNPLPWRVLVNRIWHHHFGRGIVATPSDFGAAGARPTHPELLDWLAAEFLASGQSIKRMHRAIVLSRTYRQSSAPHAAAFNVDAGTELLWRYPPRRLEAEPIRDAILQVSDRIDLRMGGPGYEVFEPNDNYVHVYVPKRRFGPGEWRRMIYQFKPRMEQDETFGAFDCPDGAQTAPRRNRSTTPLQALNLLNSPFMLQQAQLFAVRLERECGDATEHQVRRAFRLALCRAPETEETTAALALIAAHGLESFCRALYNTNEFLTID